MLRGFQFPCENCRAPVAVPGGTTENLATCPRCKQAVVIPKPLAPNQTAEPPPAAEAAYQWTDVVENGRPGDDEDWASRRRQRRAGVARRKLIVQISAALASAALAVTCTTIAYNKVQRVRELEWEQAGAGAAVPDPPRRPEPKDSWTHADLTAHLRKAGIVVTVERGGLGPPGFSTGVLVAGRDRVDVDLAPTPRAAEEAAASLGTNSFAWGRFVITKRADDGGLYARVRAALR